MMPSYFEIEKISIYGKVRVSQSTMKIELRGPTPFEDMIFYLWTDSSQIITAYLKLNSKHILFMRFF